MSKYVVVILYLQKLVKRLADKAIDRQANKLSELAEELDFAVEKHQSTTQRLMELYQASIVRSAQRRDKRMAELNDRKAYAYDSLIKLQNGGK